MRIGNSIGRMLLNLLSMLLQSATLVLIDIVFTFITLITTL